MRKYIIFIILLLVLTGCSINPYKNGAVTYLDSLEPSIEYNPDDFGYWSHENFENNYSGELIYEYYFSKENDYFYDPSYGYMSSTSLVNSSQIVNMYFSNYITSEFYWDETYANDLLSMFEYLDETKKLYVFTPTLVLE